MVSVAAAYRGEMAVLPDTLLTVTPLADATVREPVPALKRMKLRPVAKAVVALAGTVAVTAEPAVKRV